MNRLNGRRGRRTVVAAVLALALIALAGVLAVGWWRSTVAETETETAAADPGPGDLQRIGALTEAGGVVRSGSVSVSADPGDVAAGDELAVALGRASTRTELEVYGQPVEGAQGGDLNGTVTIRWSDAGLTPGQLDTVVAARWDPSLKVWRLQPEIEPTVEGDDIVLQVPHFSIWSWIANRGDDVSQALGELTGTRVGAPVCKSGAMPSWVRQVVDPDDDSPAAAIRVCFEPDGDRVTARVANNRTFTQQMSVRDGAATWAWTWPGETTYGMQQAVFDSARWLFDDSAHYLLPPLHTVAVGVARPADGAATVIEVPAQVNGITVLVDTVAWVVDQQPIGGLDNPYANAFVQVLFECGGKQVASAGGTPDALLPAVVDAVGGCAAEIMRPDSDLGQQVENLARDAVQRSTSDLAVRSYRQIGELAKAFKVLTAGKVAFYLSDQLANAAVGPLEWSIRGLGTPQVLGQWSPTCSDLAIDSNRLYRNLALQDQFSDTSRELHEFDGWSPAAREAVAPLAACPTDHRRQLAEYLAAHWGDPRAAAVVAAAMLRGLGTTGPAGDLALTDSGLGPLAFGATLSQAEATGLVTWDEDYCPADPYGKDYGSFVVDRGRFPLGKPNVIGLNDSFAAFGVGVDPETDRVARIDVYSAAIPTGEGVRVGDPVQNLRRTYGDALVEADPAYAGAQSYVLWLNRGPVDVVFDVFTGGGEPTIWRLSLVGAATEHGSTYATDDTAGGC